MEHTDIIPDEFKTADIRNTFLEGEWEKKPQRRHQSKENVLMVFEKEHGGWDRKTETFYLHPDGREVENRLFEF